MGRNELQHRFHQGARQTSQIRPSLRRWATSHPHVLRVASCVCTLARGGAPQLAVQGLGGASQPLYEVALLLVKGAEVVRCLVPQQEE